MSSCSAAAGAGAWRFGEVKVALDAFDTLGQAAKRRNQGGGKWLVLGVDDGIPDRARLYNPGSRGELRSLLICGILNGERVVACLYFFPGLFKAPFWWCKA